MSGMCKADVQGWGQGRGCSGGCVTGVRGPRQDEAVPRDDGFMNWDVGDDL
jgi:hypothetical protein